MSEKRMHVPCTIEGGCGSSDGMVENENGHKHCFACDKHEAPISPGRIAAKDGQHAKTVVKSGSSFRPLPFRFFANDQRLISLETCRKYEYGEGHDNRKDWCHITNVRDSDGDVVAQKMRYKDKRFTMVGDPPAAPTFWGQHLFSKGKRLVITEGEFDAMSVFEAIGSKWPVVSLPNGSGSVKKVFKAQSKWLEGFEEVVLCFDEDEAGEKARKEAVKLLPPGRARITKLPLKDANELWRANRGEEIRQAIWNAKHVRPDSILGTESLWGKFTESLPNSYITLPWLGLQEKWKGWRDGEITLIGAGSGVGKTTLIKEMLGHALDQGDKVGGIFLEESVRRTVQGFLTYYSAIPVHLRMMGNYDDLTAEDRKLLSDLWEEKLAGRLELYDHFGTMDPTELVRNLRYMAVGLGCKTLVLDHITMLANSAEDGNERLVLDSTIQKLRSMVEETGCRLIVVSHLNRPKGRPFEEGAQVHLGSFRGSTQLVCLSDNVLGIERNQQHPTNADFTRLRSLKCRITGDTGVSGWLKYDKKTGRMVETDEPPGGLEVSKDGHDFEDEDYS